MMSRRISKSVPRLTGPSARRLGDRHETAAASSITRFEGRQPSLGDDSVQRTFMRRIRPRNERNDSRWDDSGLKSALWPRRLR